MPNPCPIHAQSMVSPIEVDDEASGMLITAVDVVDEPTDYGQFTPLPGQAEETTGTRACLTLADAGYYSGSNLSECAGRGRRWRCQRHHRDSLEIIRTTRIRTTRIGSPTMRAATVSGVPRERRSPSTVSASPQWSPLPVLPGARSRLPSVPCLWRVHEEQGWPQRNRWAVRRGPAAPPRLDGHLGS